MANKGNKRHMKSLHAPQYYGAHRKEYAYVAKQSPGRHTLGKSVPLSTAIVRLGIAGTAAEARRAIKEGKVAVGGKPRSSPSFPVGINDIIAIRGGASYTVSINEQGKVSFSDTSADTTHYKVVGKYRAKGGRIMARLHDGTVLAFKNAKDFAVGDSVLVDANMAFKGVVPLKEGAECFIIDGVHTGTKGRIAELKPGNMHTGASAIVEQAHGEKFETLVRNIIVVG